jgi:hypothetical protein
MATRHVLHTLSNSSATRLTPNGLHSGMDITIQNVNSDGYVYIGAEDVSALSYGYRLSPNHAISWELPGTDSLYAISEHNGLKIATIATNLETGY